jgi:PAS domain S-box-containing protein
MAGRQLKSWFGQVFQSPDHHLSIRQIEETVRAIPLLASFNICAAIGISILARHAPSSFLLRGWQFIALAISVPLVLLAYRLSQGHLKEDVAKAVIRLSPLVGILLGGIWAVPIQYFPDYVPPSELPVFYALMMTIATIGIISLRYLPLAEIVFSLIMVAAIGDTMFHNINGYRHLYGYFAFGLFAPALVLMILISHRSVLRQWLAEAELIRQRQVIKLLLNDFERGTGDILWETDKASRVNYLSGKLEDRGVQPDVTIDVASALGLVEEDRNRFEQAMSSLQDIENEPYQGQIDGAERNWLISARPLQDEDGAFAGFRGVARDITQQKHQEQMLVNAKDDAEQANAAKSKFLAVISHELRTPINAIVGFSEILGTKQAENLPVSLRHEYLNTILESARHLQSLINDILDATRMERGTLQLDEQDNDVAELIEAALKICRDHATASGISLVGHVADHVLVNGDLTRLKQVVLNLLTNAIKFSPQGGIVHVSMDRGSQGALVISVRDAGIGISDEDAERVFAPFVQGEGGSNRRFNGLGLGLAICRKIARLHGGDVTLKGQPGGGAEARLILPAARVVWPPAKKSLKDEAAA